MRMNRHIALLISFLFFVANSKVQAQKVGYTNVEYILAFMNEAKKVQDQLQVFSKSLEDRLAAKEAYLNSLYEEYLENQKANKISPEQAKAVEQQLMKLEQEINLSVNDSQQKILAKQQELMEPILTKVQEAIDAIAKEDGFTFILNQTTGSNILYGLETMDITKKLASKLGVPLPAEK